MAVYMAKLRRAAKNAFMNYTPAEATVREVTRRGLVGQDPTLMQLVSEFTYDQPGRREVMGMLWKRVKDLRCHQHVLNSLELIHYLIKHGSMFVVNELQRRAAELEDFRDYVAVGEHHTFGGRVRSRAAAIFELLQDERAIQAARQLAVKTRMQISFNPKEVSSGVLRSSDSPASSIGSLDSLLTFGLTRDKRRWQRSASELTLNSFTGMDELAVETTEEVEEGDDDVTLRDNDVTLCADDYATFSLDLETPSNENQSLITTRQIPPTVFFGDEVVLSSQLTEKIIDYRRGCNGKMSVGQNGNSTEEGAEATTSSADSQPSLEIEDPPLPPGVAGGKSRLFARHDADPPANSAAENMTSSSMDAFDFYWYWAYPTFEDEAAWEPILTENVTSASNGQDTTESDPFQACVTNPFEVSVDEFGAPTWFSDPRTYPLSPPSPSPATSPSLVNVLLTNPFYTDLTSSGHDVSSLWNPNFVQGNAPEEEEDLISFDSDDEDDSSSSSTIN